MYGSSVSMAPLLLDVSRMTELGWTARTSLNDGITATYAASPFRDSKK